MLMLNEEEREQMAAILRCSPGDVEQVFEPFRQAAEEEYVRMILGQRVFTRGTDVREYRLLLLIKSVYSPDLPTESQISSLFQTSATQSRSLLRAVLSKYQYELQHTITQTLRRVLKDAVVDPNDPRGRLVVIDNENVITLLNRRVAILDGKLTPITRLTSSVTTYTVSPNTYGRLLEELSK